MTKPRLYDYLDHIKQAAAQIRQFTESMDRAAFMGDPKTQKAVIADFTIIGEAATKITDMHPAYAASRPEVPWRQVRRMRNILVHEYFSVDLNLVWDTVQKDVPNLIAIIEEAIPAPGGSRVKGNHTMNPRIIRRRLLLAGLVAEVDVSTDFSGIFDQLRDRMKALAERIPHQAEPVRRFGWWMPHYAQSGQADSGRQTRRLYFTGHEITRLDSLPGDLCVKALPESDYVAFREESQRGSMARHIYRAWLPASAYVLNQDILGDLEVFDDPWNMGESGACDVMVAIVPKPA